MRTNRFTGNPEEIIRRELPAYLAYLRDYQVPESLKGEERFGMKAYKHPDLMQAAQAGSKTAEVRDLIEIWKEQHFRQVDGQCWTGTAGDLWIDMQATEVVRGLCNATIRSTTYLGKMLKQLDANASSDGPRTANYFFGFAHSPESPFSKPTKSAEVTDIELSA